MSPKFRETLTWTCHICGEERPDAMISVESHKRVIPGTNQKVIENVRYCNDKAECTSAAPKYTFMAKRKPITASRKSRAVGE